MIKKIFITLIVVVACVLIGGLVLNLLLPNAVTAGVNAIEAQIYKATSLSFDINGDGITGKASAGTADFSSTTGDTGADIGGGNVDGFS